MRSTVPSLEPPSTTIHSTLGYVTPRIDSTVSARSAASLKVAVTTVTSGFSGRDALEAPLRRAPPSSFGDPLDEPLTPTLPAPFRARRRACADRRASRASLRPLPGPPGSPRGRSDGTGRGRTRRAPASPDPAG